MSYILIAIGFFCLGVLSFPLIMHLRARRSPDYDKSNMLNMYRIIGFISTRTALLSTLTYPNGKKPFSFVKNDATENVDMLP